MRTICCMCQKVKHKGDWLEEAVEDQVRLSHGFCPECYEKTMARVCLEFAKPRAKKMAARNK
ncbi:hypothetical protein ACUUL3_00010 [Thiovibrio sp. JS02]